MSNPSGAPGKKPYTAPVLTGLDLFGAEASASACCRTSNLVCSPTARGTLQMTIDASKAQANTNS